MPDRADRLPISSAKQGKYDGRGGTRKNQDLMGNTHLVSKSAAESGAILNDSALADNYLAEVVAAWSTLPEITRQAILNLVHDARRTNV